VSEFTVIPDMDPPSRAADTTVTPVAKALIARRNACSGSISIKVFLRSTTS
jgi:hypothetical protein